MGQLHFYKPVSPNEMVMLELHEKLSLQQITHGSLKTAAYGLVNCHSKWQNQSDQVLLNYGMQISKIIPQLFFKRDPVKLVLIVAKIVDDLQVAGSGWNVQ